MQGLHCHSDEEAASVVTGPGRIRPQDDLHGGSRAAHYPVGSGRRARPWAAVPDRGPPCPTAGRRARPWAAVPTVGRRARPCGPPCPPSCDNHRAFAARTTTAGRPYTVAWLWRSGPPCPTAGRRARPRRATGAAVPDCGPPCPTAGRRARPYAAVPDRTPPCPTIHRNGRRD
ncbi:MAG: hypothetical protein H6638_13220 [Ardenticatenales bacterium]|nr:hypothetical protein [Ardenticatenales bacterium]